MGRPQSHTKDAVGRTDRLAKLSGGSSPLTSLNSKSKGMKKVSKFTSHTGVIDKRPKVAAKGSNMDVADLLDSLSSKAPLAAEAPKRGDMKRQLGRDTLLSNSATSEALLPPTILPVSTTSSGPKKSRAGRNQVLLEQGQAYASVAALAASTAPGTSTSFSQPTVDPFSLINSHLASVINSAPAVDAGPAYVRPTKPTAHKPANAAHYKGPVKSSIKGNHKSSSHSKRR